MTVDSLLYGSHNYTLYRAELVFWRKMQLSIVKRKM